MGRLLAAIARALSALRTVWVWCAETGKMVAVQVVTLGGLLGGGSAPDPEEPPAPVGPLTNYRLPDVQKTKRIKRLAAAMDAPDIDASLFVGVDDPVVTWLAAMDPPMRSLVANAGAMQLEDHMKGRHPIRGLLAFDRESVAAWKEAGGGGAGGGKSRKPMLREVTASAFSKMAG
jgi:hypothetical protein